MYVLRLHVVITLQHHPVLSVIHSLILQHEDSRTSTLISRVNSATASLPIVPTLHGIALGTITVGYQQLVSQYEVFILLHCITYLGSNVKNNNLRHRYIRAVSLLFMLTADWCIYVGVILYT